MVLLSGMDDIIENDYETTHPIGTVVSITHVGRLMEVSLCFERYVRKRDDLTLWDRRKSK